MTLRLLHTADWQLGKPYHTLPAEVAPLLREARFAAVRTIAELAARHEAAAASSPVTSSTATSCPSVTIVQALAAMRGFAGPWVLLPGNHDPALAEGVWSRLERLGRPGNVIVAATASPIALADGRLVVLPAPLTERHTSDDLTAWMDAAVTPSGAVRVGLAHGSVAGRLPDTAEAANPIDPERANRAQLDYLAWATGTARSRSARAPGTPARPSPTASVPTTPATCSWWNWPGGRGACDHAPAHRTACLAPAEPRSHRDRRPQGGAGSAARGCHRPGTRHGPAHAHGRLDLGRARRWKRRSTAGRASSATWRSATSWWPSPASVTSSASANRR